MPTVSHGRGDVSLYFANLFNSRRRPTPVSTRVSATERVRAVIDELFASEKDLGDVLEDVARLGVRLPMQAAIG
jgi:hypothetical protein